MEGRIIIIMYFTYPVGSLPPGRFRVDDVCVYHGRPQASSRTYRNRVRKLRSVPPP